MSNSIVAHNFAQLQERINQACQKAGRSASEVRLLPVTKTFPTETILEAYALGYKQFGENKIQEAQEKYESLQEQYPDIEWILIGHLQRNKVKHVVDFITEFHALDSLRLANRLNNLLQAANRVLPVYVQINTSGEKSKYGLQPEELTEFLKASENLKQLKIIGLMTLAINSENETEIRHNFKTLRELRDQAQQSYPTIQRLSMGMSGDFEIAIEEGATDIRLGQSIFGKRDLPDEYYWPA